MSKIKEGHSILESADVVAFVSLHQNINPKPLLRKSDNRVVFIFDTDVADALQAFYGNSPVPIADYCSKLKLIRSMIFSLKGTGIHGK